MSSNPSVLNRAARLAIFLCSLALALSALGQESYLVSTQDGKVSMYDLATNSFVMSAKLGGSSFNMVPSLNPRLAFVSIRSSYYSVLDMTLNREITRIKGVKASSGTFTPDSSLFVAPDFSLDLDVIDAARLKLVRKVNLKSVQPPGSFPGQIVATNTRAYAFPRTASSTPKIAVVDLSTYALSSISLPSGSVCRKCGAITPDGSTLVAIDRGYDGKVHVVLISTATNKIISDKVQDNLSYAQGLVITPKGTDPSKLYGYVVGNLNGIGVMALDLVVNSPTYGMILPATKAEVDLSLEEMAINSDGSQLVVVGIDDFQFNDNVETYNTAKLLSDPANARTGTLNVGSGMQVTAVCIGTFSTNIPNTAPVVTSVSGDITNDAQHDIQITGGNFQQGALVRIGSMDPLPANVMGGGILSVTVPAMAPGGRALDIVVTNPGTNKPPDQQNQSGLLAGHFNILLDATFQPKTQFATVNADNSFSIYDRVQRTMVNDQSANLGDFFDYSVFNIDGRELDIKHVNGRPGNAGCCAVLPVDLTNNSLEPSIRYPASSDLSPQWRGIAGSKSPLTGKPVVDIVWCDDDLHVSVIDTDSTSPTYHTIIQTFNAGRSGDYPYAYTMTVSPNGRYAYIWFDTPGPGNLGIMDLTTGAFTSFAYDGLAVNTTQYQIHVTPDGKSLLLASAKGNRPRIRIFDLSSPMQPRFMAEITPVPVPSRGFPTLSNYQVVGDQLYGIDVSGILVVFNFRKDTGDFRERGYYVLPNGFWDFAFSADGTHMYLADGISDQITVMAASKIASGHDGVITSLRAPYAPESMAVSPVPPPASLLKTPAPIDNKPTPQRRK